jgi:hypothetical protein
MRSAGVQLKTQHVSNRGGAKIQVHVCIFFRKYFSYQIELSPVTINIFIVNIQM